MDGGGGSRWDFTGFLRKHNRLSRDSQRWFALRGQELHYFERQHDVHPKYVIDLHGVEIVRSPSNNTFELLGAALPKGEKLVLEGADTAETEGWIAALRHAAMRAAGPLESSSSGGKSGGFMAMLNAKVERVLKIDLDGDGRIGAAQTPLLLEYDRVKRLNGLLRQVLERFGATPAHIAQIIAPVDDRIVALACKKERTLHQRRIVMDSFIDGIVDRAQHKLRKFDALNKLESGSLCTAFGVVGDTVNSHVDLPWNRWTVPSFGKPMAHLFRHQNITLDSVTYGTCPIPILEARRMWDHVIQQDPVLFRFKALMLRLKEAAAKVSLVIQANVLDVVLLNNAPQGISTVLKSQAWRTGDRLAVLSCSFARTKAAAQSVATQFGVEVVVILIQFPCTDDDIVSATESRLAGLRGFSPKLACFPHVTFDGWVLPVKRLTKLFHEYGVAVLVDGTLAVGYVDVNVGNLSADFYIASLDRWLFAPAGVGFLVVPPHKQNSVSPLTVSYFYGQGFEKEFSYTGLQDFGTWTTLMQSMEFVERMCGGVRGIQDWCWDLARQMVECLERMWGTRAVQTLGGSPCYGRLPVIPVPNGSYPPPESALRLMYFLAVQHRMQAFCFVGNYGVPTLCVRLSAQVFGHVSDAEALGWAILGLNGEYGGLPLIPPHVSLEAMADME